MTWLLRYDNINTRKQVKAIITLHGKYSCFSWIYSFRSIHWILCDLYYWWILFSVVCNFLSWRYPRRIDANLQISQLPSIIWLSYLHHVLHHLHHPIVLQLSSQSFSCIFFLLRNTENTSINLIIHCLYWFECT